MVVRFCTNLYILLAGFTLSAATGRVYAQATSVSPNTEQTAVADTHGRTFGVTREKGYFEYRSDVPLVEQFMNKRDSAHRS